MKRSRTIHAQLPIAKKPKKASAVENVPERCEEQLAAINSEIKAVEDEIQRNVAEFEKVRTAMATGIVTYEGFAVKDKIETLTGVLEGLKRTRDDSVKKFDDYIVTQMIGSTLKRVPAPDASDAPAKGKKRRRTDGGERVDVDVDGDDADDQGEGYCCPDGCTELIFDRIGGIDICKECGAIYDHRIDSESQYFSYGDVHIGDAPRRRGCGYKPPNHFAEILAQFQGCRRSSAPQAVVDKVRTYCDRYRIREYKRSTQVVRMVLKTMQQAEMSAYRWLKSRPKAPPCKYTDYYKHCSEISYVLSGIPPPYMTPAQRDKVVALFPLVIAAYRTSPRYITRKKNRVNRKKENPNSLNYFYAFYKIVQMLGYNEFLPYIPLPKSLSNIEDCDYNGWKHICEVNRWRFIPTR